MTRDSKSLFKEAFSTFSAVLVVIIVLALLAGWIPLIADVLYALVALVFLIVPQKILERNDEDFDDFGLTRKEPLKAIGWGMLFTLLTLPFFAVGYWVWEVQIQKRNFDFDTTHYWQWPVETQDEPIGWGKESAGVWIWGDDDALHVGLRNNQERNNRVILESDKAFLPNSRGSVTIVALDEGVRSGEPSKKWALSLKSSRGRGAVRVDGAQNAKVSVSPIVEGSPTWPIYVGPAQTKIEGTTWSDKRGLLWIVLWVATQFLLIALPEEYFYRGYLQTRLNQAFVARSKENGKAPMRFLGFTPAIFLASFLFGVGHLLVPIGGVLIATRMSVFFPSLLFGWLRDRTEGIGASIVYHACSNLMVLFAAVHFS